MKVPHKPLALERVWKRLVSFFDDGPLWPRRIASRGFLLPIEKRILCQWLRRVEEIARRLLLIEALRLDAPTPPVPRNCPRRARQPALSYCCEHALEPNEWRVRFRICPPVKRTRKSRTSRFYIRWTIDGYRYRRRKAPESYPAMPIARRAEALWRVLRDRRVYAARLARRLNVRSGRETLLAARAAYAAMPDLARPGAGYRKSGPLLRAVQVHAAAALNQALGRHALAGWDSS